jgi:glutamyl-tRNA synthetase
VPKTGSIFDFNKLKWFNGQYIRAFSTEELAKRLVDYSVHPKQEIERVLPLIHDRLVLLGEFDELVAFLFEEQDYDTSLLIGKNHSAESTRDALSEVTIRLASLADWPQEEWETAIREVATGLGWKAGDLFMALRVAITFSTASPPLRESMVLLGREKSLARLHQAVQKLS